MKKLVIAFAAFFLLARYAGAQDLSARALLAFEHYATDQSSRSGFRQTYDLRLDRALSGNSSIHIFFRGDDFRGTTGGGSLRSSMGSRQIQPGGEFMINLWNVLAQFRTETFDTQTRTGDQRFGRRLDRSSANITWAPQGFPQFRFLGQRNTTKDDATNLQLTDDAAGVATEYSWKGMAMSAAENYTRSTDPNAGFRRSSTLQTGTLGYSTNSLRGKLSLHAETSAQRMIFDESGLGNNSSSVPTPVPANHALYSLDDTPSDNHDHVPVEIAALIDGDLNSSTSVSLGPASASFQNLILDIGHTDRLDEVRVIVRDEIHNPLRNGGGPVTWDVYTSQDGLLWTTITAQTTFDAVLSYYSITFPQVSTRWIKVVNFGVNADATFVTELQAYYHTTIGAGQQRRGTQNGYSIGTGLTAYPSQRLTVSYGGVYTSINQELDGTPRSSTSSIDHLGSIQYQLTKTLAARVQLMKRDVRNFSATLSDGASGISEFLDYQPTKQLLLSLENGTESETLAGTEFTIATTAIHGTAYVLRSLQVQFDAGRQTQVITADATTGRRDFANLTANAQLTTRLRMLFTTSLQRTHSESTDPVVQLLGPSRDDRVSSDFIWRSGRALSIAARFGWVSGQAISAFTQRYHVEWFPFADGTVSLGSSYDEDIDPMTNRRAKRLLFNPRWTMNRYAIFNINYTAVSTSSGSSSNWQKSLFATLTLTR